MSRWRNIFTAEGLGPEVFARPPLGPGPFRDVAFVLVVGLAGSALVIVPEWSMGRMPAFMALWIVAVWVSMVRSWLWFLGQHRKLRALFEQADVMTAPPGSALDVALRAAASAMYVGLMRFFIVSAGLILSVGIALALH